MKRLILFAATLCLLASCSHKEGELDTRRHLTLVYAAEKAVVDGGSVYYDYPLHLVQAWQWEGDELFRVEYSETSGTFAENLYYDGRDRLERAEVPAHRLSARFAYDGRDLERIDILKAGDSLMSYTFEHEKGQIVSIVQRHPSGRAVGYTLRWDGDNVTYMKKVCGDSVSEIRYTYDDKRNPLRDYFSLNLLRDGFDPVMVSRNNVTAYTVSDPEGTLTRRFAYTYEKKYPVSRTCTYSYGSMNSETYEPLTITVTEERRFEYQETENQD